MFVAQKLKFITSILLLSFVVFSPGQPSLTGDRNQFQMAPARPKSWLLHSVHPRFKLPRKTYILRGSLKQGCVGANCSDAQEPFEIDFCHTGYAWLARRENNKENQ